MKLSGLTRAAVLVALMVSTVVLFATVSGCRQEAAVALPPDVADAPTGEVEVVDADEGEIIEGTTANFDAEVLRSDLPVLVDFGADWCPPCRRLHPNVVTIAAEYSGRAKVVAVDVDQAGSLARKYGVSGIPALVVIVDGRKADGAVGYRTEAQLRTLLDKHVK